MFENGHEVMRQTQNGFGKGNWKASEATAEGQLQPADDDSEEQDVDEDEEDDDQLEDEDAEEGSDHNF